MPPFKRRPQISKFLNLYLIGVLKNIFKILLPILIGMYIIWYLQNKESLCMSERIGIGKLIILILAILIRNSWSYVYEAHQPVSTQHK